MLSNSSAQKFLELTSSPSLESLSSPPPLPPTPCSNTGLNPHSELLPSGVFVGIHWLQGCGVYIPHSLPSPGFGDSRTPLDFFTEMINFVCHTFSDVPVFSPEKGSYIGRYWSSTGSSPCGIKFAWNSLSDGSLEYFLSIPGSVCDRVSVRVFWATLRSLVSLNYFRPTRIDVALDDYDKSVSLSQVESAARSKNFGRFRSYRIYESGSLDSDSSGKTVYFGSSQSDKMLRIYDKNIESSGRSNCIRWEIQLRREAANSFVSHWLLLNGSAMPDDDEFSALSPALLGGVIIGSIEFIHRTDEELSRCKKLDWWAIFQDKIGSSYRLSVPKKIISMESKIHWVFSQLSPTFAIFKKSLGVDGFYSLVSSLILDGESRLKEHHLALIRSSLLAKELDQQDKSIDLPLSPKLLVQWT